MGIGGVWRKPLKKNFMPSQVSQWFREKEVVYWGVTQLVSVAVLYTEKCGFESHLPDRLMW